MTSSTMPSAQCPSVKSKCTGMSLRGCAVDLTTSCASPASGRSTGRGLRRRTQLAAGTATAAAHCGHSRLSSTRRAKDDRTVSWTRAPSTRYARPVVTSATSTSTSTANRVRHKLIISTARLVVFRGAFTPDPRCRATLRAARTGSDVNAT